MGFKVICQSVVEGNRVVDVTIILFFLLPSFVFTGEDDNFDLIVEAFNTNQKAQWDKLIKERKIRKKNKKEVRTGHFIKSIVKR